jgi:hypothetical protein
MVHLQCDCKDLQWGEMLDWGSLYFKMTAVTDSETPERLWEMKRKATPVYVFFFGGNPTVPEANQSISRTKL